MTTSEPNEFRGTARTVRETPFLVLTPEGRAPRGGWAAVVALHGYGWDEERFSPVLRLRFGGVPWAWIVPRGPFRVHVGTSKEVGYGWLVGNRDHPDNDGMRVTERLLQAAVAGAARLAAVDRRRVAIAGFSQGGVVAGTTALRHPRRWRAAAVLGGYVSDVLGPADLTRSRGARIGFFHGRDDDDVVPDRPRASEAALRAARVETEFHLVPGGHKIGPEMALAAKAFLLDALA